MKRLWVALVLFGAALVLFIGTAALSGKPDGQENPPCSEELMALLQEAPLRFTDNKDGTVTDNVTGLVWTKVANLFGQMAWAPACADCATLNSGEHGLTDGSVEGDWRLPHVKELQSLIDYGVREPALPAGHPFTGVQFLPGGEYFYWSSTTYAGNADEAWRVGYHSGDVYHTEKTYSPGLFVWCVRGSQ